ncbi:levansucrase [Micromonospora sp. 15K316]|uniref:levansucrase n=1 Tax=Micromonospora sp. 15K316 TaxID=2530376 RepID=UPI001052360C|nr:levansucrase [Micromonospora sp. 15K316]TDC33131.1 levansucrase [Micromonospora sp. 15K316]
MDTSATESVRAYIETTGHRLQADGCEVTTEDWGGLPVLVGYRADFKMRWMATKLHLFTVAAPTTLITESAIEEFTDSAFDYVLARKGQLRGMQTGVAVFPALVGTQIEPRALAWARQKQHVRFAAAARPVVVDARTGNAVAFRGTPLLGLVYSAHLRRKLAAYFPAA